MDPAMGRLGPASLPTIQAAQAEAATQRIAVQLPGDVKVPLRRGGPQPILKPIGGWCMQHAICLVWLEHQPAPGAELGETKDTKLPSQLVEAASMAVARTN